MYLEETEPSIHDSFVNQIRRINIEIIQIAVIYCL